MNRIVKVLMERDNMSQEDAQDLFNEALEELNNMMEGDYSLCDVEELIEDYFGLEPDYMFDFLPL